MKFRLEDAGEVTVKVLVAWENSDLIPAKSSRVVPLGTTGSKITKLVARQFVNTHFSSLTEELCI